MALMIEAEVSLKRRSISARLHDVIPRHLVFFSIFLLFLNMAFLRIFEVMLGQALNHSGKKGKAVPLHAMEALGGR
jgi:hypothetical protein